MESQTEERCSVHPDKVAAYTCSCGANLCETCALFRQDGSACCYTCSAKGPTDDPILNEKVKDRKCINHTEVQATAICRKCQVFLCHTCAFQFPGGLTLCPDCATNDEVTLSRKRKKDLIMATIFGFCNVCLFIFMIIGLPQMDPGEIQSASVLLGYGIMIFSITGTVFSLKTMDKRLGNPVIVWVVAGMNVCMLIGFIMLTILGNMA